MDRYGVPENLENAITKLEQILSEEDLSIFRDTDEVDLYLYHHGLGRAIRNKWQLWYASKLACFFKAKGITHPDDMSSIILTSLHRKLNRKDIKLECQIQKYKDYWESYK
jgi:hypothetical protein